MEIEIKIPSVGESVNEAILAEWYKQDRDTVRKDEPILVIETDKVTLEVTAEADGILRIKVSQGETVAIGSVVGTIETDATRDQTEEAVPESDTDIPASSEPIEDIPKPAEQISPAPSQPRQIFSPSVRRLIAEKNIDAAKITGTGPGGRVTKSDLLIYQASLLKDQLPSDAPPSIGVSGSGEEKSDTELVERKAMTPIRKRIAARLLEAKQNTAMLTTFNEIDMSRTMSIRRQYKDIFQKKHGVSLGFMSFFVKACVEALKEFPEINAFIEDGDIVYHNYYHIGVAIGSGRGLVVPIIRHAEQLSFAETEQVIIDYVTKINENRLELADMAGGTFTISNGGVYGSLLSTPILNTPQSGILGMHKIEKRPVVVDDQMVIRPMMYVALSYDHRIVDGREAVTFLKRIKECVEDPERMMIAV